MRKLHLLRSTPFSTRWACCWYFHLHRQFAWLMQKLVPETGVPLLRRLDESLLSEPGSAV